MHLKNIEMIMIRRMLKASLPFMVVCVFTMSSNAQTSSAANDGGNVLSLSLQNTIDIACDSALQAFQAKYILESSQLNYQSFLASRKWQLGLKFNPSYEHLSISPEAYYASGAGSNNALSAGATLDFNQLIGSTGGYIYASSNIAWSEFFGNNADSYKAAYGCPRMFGATPIRVGYRQELLGYNAAEWEKKIQDKHIETAKNEYISTLADIAETAAGYFFRYASSKALYDMYVVNAISADSLYKIGLEKYAITSIRKDELLSLQLQLMNSQNDVRSSLNSLQQAKLSLMSYLKLDKTGIDIEVTLPSNPDHTIIVDPEKAVEYAKLHNPAFGQVEEANLQAQQELDRAKREKNFQMNLDLSVGLQKFGPSMSDFGSKNKAYTVGQVTLAIPIYDHGMRKSQYNAAKSRLDYYNVQQMETERTFKENIYNTIRDLEMQQQMLVETQRAMELADESFAQNQYNYAQGLSDINTFTWAQNRKDSAHINYINALSSFWLAYYRLCSLTLYDFYNMKPLLDQD